MKPARLVGFVSGILGILCLAFLYTQRSYLHFVPQSAFAAGQAQFFGVKFFDVANTAYFLDPSASGSDYSLIVNNNVGIGITSPGAKLEISGVASGGDEEAIRIGVTGENIGSIKFFDTNDEAGQYARVGYHAAANLLYLTNAGAGMIVNSSGNVGIGTTAPLLKLDVAGSERVTATLTSNLTGTADPAASTTLPGTDTLFLTELVVGDRITVNAETRTVTAIASNISLTVDTAFTDTAGGATIAKLPAEFIVRDSSNNIDLIVQDSGYVGIGTEAPGAILDISKAAATIPRATFTTTSSFGGWYVYENATSKAAMLGIGSAFSTAARRNDLELYSVSGDISFWPNSVQEVTFKSGGLVGIGTTAPSQTLHVEGTTRLATSVATTDNAYFCTDATGDVERKTAVCTVSALRYKENIRDLAYGLDEINRLRPVFYNYKTFDENNPEGRTKRRIGLIAEEIVPIIPEVVLWNEEGLVDSIDYPYLAPLLIKGIQEQQMQINNLKTKMNNLSLTGSGDLDIQQITGTDNYAVRNTQDNSFINRIGAFAEIVVGKIRAGIIETKKLVLDGIDVAAKLSELSARIDKQEQTILQLQTELEQLKTR